MADKVKKVAVDIWARRNPPAWFSLLRNDTDVNRRLAMIAIDNAVELTIKTYLGLPKRITGLTIFPEGIGRDCGELARLARCRREVWIRQAPHGLSWVGAEPLLQPPRERAPGREQGPKPENCETKSTARLCK